MCQGIQMPNLISFIGVDNKVELNNLLQLSRQYSQVEWGFRLSQEKMHEPGYPSWMTIERMAPMGMRTVVLLQDRQIFESLLAQHSRNQIVYYLKMFSKIQVETDIKDFDDDKLVQLYDIVYGCMRMMLLPYHEGTKSAIKKWMELRKPDTNRVSIVYHGINPEPENDFEIQYRRRFTVELDHTNVEEVFGALGKIAMVNETGYAVAINRTPFDTLEVVRTLDAIYHTPDDMVKHEES